MHRCIDDLIKQNGIDFDSYSSDIEWTRADFEKARNLIQGLYHKRAENEELKLEGISKEVQAALENCYNVRKQEIHQAIANRSLLESGVEDLVENFDWKVKWIMGSSKMASLREAALQMDLHCVNRSVNCEMNLEKVDLLISELEKVKGELKTKK